MKNKSDQKKIGKNFISEFIINALKGISVGIANVIPGVSGGTLLVITGIFERTINAIKSFDLKALNLLLKFKIKELIKYIDFYFLLAIGTGMIIAILSVAKLFAFLFKNYPVYIWAFFFGLIAPSIYYVGRTIKKWSSIIYVFFLTGVAFAIWLAFVNPTTQNDNLLYVFLCGMISITAMILPGISGSFVLLLMGNYYLIVIKSINEMNLSILLPFAFGCVIGLIVFAHLLSLILKKFYNETMAVLTGFIAGSLYFIWPWKKAIYALDPLGNILIRKGEQVILKYQNFIPEKISSEVIIAIICAIAGVIIIYITEKLGEKK